MEFQQGDVMVVALLILIVGVDMVLIKFMIVLLLFVNFNIMFSCKRERGGFFCKSSLSTKA